MRSSWHSLDRIGVTFGDERLVANGGLLLPATLAQHLGLLELFEATIDLGDAPGRANVGPKAMTVIHSALAGGDSIDDCDALRAGSTEVVLGQAVRAASTVGTFVRSFTWGHARQLDKVAGAALARAWAAGAGPGDSPVTLDARRPLRPHRPHHQEFRDDNGEQRACRLRSMNASCNLFEAEGINTMFGIADPNFVHLFHLAEERGWQVVSPHHEESAGFMAEAVSWLTGKAAICIGMLGPGVANLAGAMMCAGVEKSPVIFLGGQRARITEQRARRDRIQFVEQSGALLHGEHYIGGAVGDHSEAFFAR